MGATAGPVSVIIPVAPDDGFQPSGIRGAGQILSVRGGTPGEARNMGARSARYDNLLFLDADMRVEADVSELPDCDLATAYYRTRVPRDRWIAAFQNAMARRGNMWSFFGGFMYMKRRVFDDVGGFRSGTWEDIEFAWRARKRGYRVTALPLEVLHVRPFRYRRLARGFLGDGWAWGFGQAEPEIASLKLFGLRMELDPDDRAISPHLRGGEWEPVETGLLLLRLRRGEIFVDVGAHMGYFTLVASKIVGPEGRVYAFEPNPKVFAYLERNIALNGLSNVVAANKAVYSESATIGFWPENVGNTGDSQIFEDPNRREIAVPAVSLDEELGPLRVDFLKSDAQGAEHYVFRGARNLIRHSPRISIMFEYAPELFRKRDLPGEEIWEFLASEGFTLRHPSRMVPAVSREQFLGYTNFLNLYCQRE